MLLQDRRPDRQSKVKDDEGESSRAPALASGSQWGRPVACISMSVPT